MGRSILLSPAYLLDSETPQSQFYITKLRTTQMLPAVLPSCIIHVSLHRRLQTRTPSRQEALWNPFPRTSPYSITMPSITSITCAANAPCSDRTGANCSQILHLFTKRGKAVICICCTASGAMSLVAVYESRNQTTPP